MLWKSEAVAFVRGFLPLNTIIEIRDQQRLEQYRCSERRKKHASMRRRRPATVKKHGNLANHAAL